MSRKTRDRLLAGTGISTVPLLHVGTCSKEDYEKLLKSTSTFHDGVVEGVYVRIDEDENKGLPLQDYYGSGGKSKPKKAGRGRGAKGGKSKPAPKEKVKEKGADTSAPESKKEEEEEDSYLIDRAKIVRADFLPVEDPDIMHWSRQMLVKNIVTYN